MWSWELHGNSGSMEPRASWGGRGVGGGHRLDIGETLVGGGESGVGIASGRHKKEPRLREPRSPALAQAEVAGVGPHQLSGRPSRCQGAARPPIPSELVWLLAHAGMGLASSLLLGQDPPKPSESFSTLRCA